MWAQAGRAPPPLQFKRRKTLCRPATDGQCDLPEFCSGSSASCPPDVYVQDGNDCGYGTGYCYHGRCQSLELQCKRVYGRGNRAVLGALHCVGAATASPMLSLYLNASMRQPRVRVGHLERRHSFRKASQALFMALVNGVLRCFTGNNGKNKKQIIFCGQTQSENFPIFYSHADF